MYLVEVQARRKIECGFSATLAWSQDQMKRPSCMGFVSQEYIFFMGMKGLFRTGIHAVVGIWEKFQGRSLNVVGFRLS
jgi:hypothetical protein